MPTPYTEDCISFTGAFQEPFGYPIHTHMDHLLRIHAIATGMSEEDITDAVMGPGNYLYLQPDSAPRILQKGYTFIPPDDFIQTLYEVYLQNQPHQPKDRAGVKTGTNGLEFMFMNVYKSSRPIFLRHPVTGTVTKHEHPYPAFPYIRLRSADPSFIAVTASRKLSKLNMASGSIQRFARTHGYFAINSPHGWFTSSGRPPAPKPPITRLPTPGPNCPALATRPANSALPPSRKRLRDTAPSDPCPPPKRSRATPCIPPRRNPSRAAKTKAREAMAPSARRRRRAP